MNSNGKPLEENISERQQIARLTAELQRLILRQAELEKMVLTWRQAQIIMLGGADEYLRLERKVPPRKK